jgi:parallel beta-helix repeat protein
MIGWLRIGAIVLAALVAPQLWAKDDSTEVQRAINGCRSGGTVQLEPRLYSVNPLRLKSDCTYSGVPGKTILKLLAPNLFIFDISERKGIHIKGIQFDGSNIGGAIVARENGPSSSITVENCSFTGVSSVAIFPANIAIVSTWALIDASFRNNKFENIAAGLWFTTVQNVSIQDNTFNQVTQGDAIYIAPNPVPFRSGENLKITGNHGSGFARIAVEIFRPDPTNGSTLIAPLIENNTFSDWTSPKDGMGLSITHGDGATIRNNTIRNMGQRPPQYLGIEVIVKNALVENNRIDHGFAYGIAVQGTAAPRIVNNQIEGAADTGIILACDAGRNRCASHDSFISNNTISEARRVGIALDNDWAGSKVVSNTISRAGGQWPGDEKTLFAGIHQLGATGAGTIDSNTIEQTASAPPKGFDFCGVNLTAPIPGSTITNNVVRSNASGRLGTGILGPPGAWTIDKNRFQNLAREKS